MVFLSLFKTTKNDKKSVSGRRRVEGSENQASLNPSLHSCLALRLQRGSAKTQPKGCLFLRGFFKVVETGSSQGRVRGKVCRVEVGVQGQVFREGTGSFVDISVGRVYKGGRLRGVYCIHLYINIYTAFG
jgi:hypothetical protein